MKNKKVTTTYKKVKEDFRSENDLLVDVENFLNIYGRAETWKHVSNVAQEAKMLAHRFSENLEDAFYAGLLHDISAIFPISTREAVAIELGIDVLLEEKICPDILHQKISRVMTQDLFGIDKQSILSAVACHTTLKRDASVLDKIVFIADKIRWDREYKAPFIDDVLTALEISLDEACFSYLDYLWRQKEDLPVVHPWFIEAHEWLGRSLCKK